MSYDAFIFIILILLGIILFAYKDKLTVLYKTQLSENKENFSTSNKNTEEKGKTEKSSFISEKIKLIDDKSKTRLKDKINDEFSKIKKNFNLSKNKKDIPEKETEEIIDITEKEEENKIDEVITKQDNDKNIQKLKEE